MLSHPLPNEEVSDIEFINQLTPQALNELLEHSLIAASRGEQSTLDEHDNGMTTPAILPLSKLSPASRTALMQKASEYCPHITSASKPNNEWGFLEFFAWGYVLRAAGVTQLDLSGNKLYNLSKVQLVFLKASVTQLDLGMGVLTAGLALGLAVSCGCATPLVYGLAVSANLLDLNPNKYFKLIMPQRMAFFEVLKGSGITQLDLSKSSFNKLSASQWSAFLAGLKGSGITHLHVHDNDLDASRVEELEAIIKKKYLNSHRPNPENPNSVTPLSLKELCNVTLFTKVSNYAEGISQRVTFPEHAKDMITQIDEVEKKFSLNH